MNLRRVAAATIDWGYTIACGLVIGVTFTALLYVGNLIAPPILIASGLIVGAALGIAFLLERRERR